MRLKQTWPHFALAGFCTIFLLSSCGDEKQEELPVETPGLSGINFQMLADGAGDLHITYRGFAPGDNPRPEQWTRVYYRHFRAASGSWDTPLQVHNESETPADASGRYNQPRLTLLPGSSRVAIGWSLDFRRTRGVLVSLVDSATSTLLASADIFNDSASWEIKQLALTGLDSERFLLFSTRITPSINEVWENEVRFDGQQLSTQPAQLVGGPTGQDITAALHPDGSVSVASSFGNNRRNLLLASRPAGGSYRAERRDIEGGVGKLALLQNPLQEKLSLFFVTSLDEEQRRLGFLQLDSSSRDILDSRSLEGYRVTPENSEAVQAAVSPSGREAIAWGRGTQRTSFVLIREPGQEWPSPEQLSSRAFAIPESDHPVIAFSGETLHVVYRDLEKRGTSHLSYLPDGTKRVLNWDL